jgi:hypothetical protein
MAQNYPFSKQNLGLLAALIVVKAGVAKISPTHE